jgi:hypothetical protein
MKSPYLMIKNRYNVTYEDGSKKEFISNIKNIGRLANVEGKGLKVIDIEVIEKLGR